MPVLFSGSRGGSLRLNFEIHGLLSLLNWCSDYSWWPFLRAMDKIVSSPLPAPMGKNRRFQNNIQTKLVVAWGAFEFIEIKFCHVTFTAIVRSWHFNEYLYNSSPGLVYLGCRWTVSNTANHRQAYNEYTCLGWHCPIFSGSSIIDWCNFVLRQNLTLYSRLALNSPPCLCLISVSVMGVDYRCVSPHLLPLYQKASI